ncbi:MAG: aldehyde ferredoxin oxidoreductase C-terminal domain-containing protein, partial [Chloroflexota bacterium]
GIILQGAAPKWCYLHIHDGTAELRDAGHLLGKDTWETDEILKRELGPRCSVHGIGPAGENLVRFAAIAGDRGHVASKNGMGAVLGSKRLKAIVAGYGGQRAPIRHPEHLKAVALELFENAKSTGQFYQWGTAGSVSNLHATGYLPVKNYTTSIFPEHEGIGGQYTRTHYKRTLAPCWACRMNHSSLIEVTEGPYKGVVGDEPDYECIAAMGPVIGQTEPGAMIMLANLVDKLGMDINETGWLVGWVMECYERGLLNKRDLDGLDMKWGNAEATAALLRRIAHRQGVGDRLAEGVKRAAEQVGGEAQSCAIYTVKGNSPRGHDHRSLWTELIDTCVSNTGTIEAAGNNRNMTEIGIPPVKNRFDPEEMSARNAAMGGRRQFEDCLGVCLFCMQKISLELEALNAATGWNVDVPEALTVGRRIAHLLRVFNFRHGLTRESEAPSARYGSAPVDGPAKGISILLHWDFIRRNYYLKMGWDPETGKPLPQTLEQLGLGHLVADLR